MSDFMLNIARRSAGLGPGVVVEPVPGSVFVPTVSNVEMRSHDADAEDQSEGLFQSRPAVPVRSRRVLETKQHDSTLADKQSRSLGNEPRSDSGANTPGSAIGDARLTAQGREGATDRFTTDSFVVEDISFDGSAAGQPFDPQPRNLQSIIEPQSDGPQQTSEPFGAGLTPRLSDAPGKKEPSGATSRSDQIAQAPADATGTIEPAATRADNSDSLWEIRQEHDVAVGPLQQQPIQVRIGTIEVRAEQVPHRVAMNRSPAPQSGFDDYKLIR